MLRTSYNTDQTVSCTFCSLTELDNYISRERCWHTVYTRCLERGHSQLLFAVSYRTKQRILYEIADTPPFFAEPRYIQCSLQPTSRLLSEKRFVNCCTQLDAARAFGALTKCTVGDTTFVHV